MPRRSPLAVVAAVTVWLLTAGEVAGSRPRVRAGSILQIERDLGITEFLKQFFDGVGTVVFAALTQLGDVWFLFVLAGGLYLASVRPGNPLGRRCGAFVLALPIVYIVTIQALKGVFTLPRPPGAGAAATIQWIPTLLVPVFENAATAEGYGFPSGHALGTPLVWGGAALVLDYRSRRFRFAVASAAVVLVSFSRIALGVHYLVDVIGGAAIGAVLLYAVYRLTDRGTDPGRALLMAVTIGLVGLVNAVTFDSVAAFGVATGAWLAWYAFTDQEPATHRTRAMAAVSVTILVLVGLLFIGLYVSVPPAPVTAIGSAIAAAALVGAPDLGERVVGVIGSK